MVVAGTVLIALGFVIVRQINVNHRAMFLHKGTFFQNSYYVANAEILCFFLFLAGPLMLNFLLLSIRVVMCAALVLFLLMDFLKRGEPYIARKIIRIYKVAKLKTPNANANEVLKNTAVIYLKSVGADDESVNSYLGMLDRKQGNDFPELVKISSEKEEYFELHLLISMLLNYHYPVSLFYKDSFDVENMRYKSIERACIREGFKVSD